MKSTFSILAMVATIVVSAQNIPSEPIYDSYPKGQDDYKGGNVQFYKDLHDLFIAHNLTPCENKNEFYEQRLIVYPDRTIKFIKDENEQNVKANQCTIDLIRESFKYLKDWEPATIGGQKVAAITAFYIYPDDLFGNYKTGYEIFDDYYKPAEFEGGHKKFAQKIFGNMDFRTFKISNEGKQKVSFTVTSEGKIRDVQVTPSSGDSDFDEMVRRAIPDKGWTPASIHGIPMDSKINLPLAFKNGR